MNEFYNPEIPEEGDSSELYHVSDSLEVVAAADLDDDFDSSEIEVPAESGGVSPDGLRAYVSPVDEEDSIDEPTEQETGIKLVSQPNARAVQQKPESELPKVEEDNIITDTELEKVPREFEGLVPAEIAVKILQRNTDGGNFTVDDLPSYIPDLVKEEVRELFSKISTKRARVAEVIVADEQPTPTPEHLRMVSSLDGLQSIDDEPPIHSDLAEEATLKSGTE